MGYLVLLKDKKVDFLFKLISIVFQLFMRAVGSWGEKTFIFYLIKFGG